MPLFLLFLEKRRRQTQIRPIKQHLRAFKSRSCRRLPAAALLFLTIETAVAFLKKQAEKLHATKEQWTHKLMMFRTL
jgi:hypothetical protein